MKVDINLGVCVLIVLFEVVLGAVLGWMFVLEKKSWLLASSDVIMFLNLYFAKPIVLSSLKKEKTLSGRQAEYMLSPLAGLEGLGSNSNYQFPEEVLESGVNVKKRG